MTAQMPDGTTWHTVWKALQVTDDGDLVSVIAGGNAQVKYKLGRICRPPPYLLEQDCGICCFMTPRDAAQWVEYMGRWGSAYANIVVEVWEAEPFDLIWTPHSRLVWMSPTTRIENGVYRPTYDTWPPGTLMTEGLLLRSKVRPNQVREG